MGRYLRGYGATATFLLGCVFGFDILWYATSMEAIGAAFTALLIGIFAACGFVFLTEPKPARQAKPVYEFATDNTGLSVMVRRES